MEPTSAIRNLPLSNAIASSFVARYLQMVGMTDWLSPLSASCGQVPYQRLPKVHPFDHRDREGSNSEDL